MRARRDRDKARNLADPKPASWVSPHERTLIERYVTGESGLDWSALCEALGPLDPIWQRPSQAIIAMRGPSKGRPLSVQVDTLVRWFARRRRAQAIKAWADAHGVSQEKARQRWMAGDPGPHIARPVRQVGRDG